MEMDSLRLMEQRTRNINTEELFGITDKAGTAAIGCCCGRIEVIGERLLIETADENGLDGAIEDAVVGERTSAGRFQARWAIALGQAQGRLRRAQPLDDPIG